MRDTQEKIDAGGLVIVGGLHRKPFDELAAIARTIARRLQSEPLVRKRWQAIGQRQFKRYLDRGRWEMATDNHTKILLGATILAAGLRGIDAAIILGAILDVGGDACTL